MSEASERAGTEQEIVIERVFDAPRELVWQAWTELEHIERWYGPAGFAVPTCELDLRAGGRRFVVMRSAGGEEHRTAGVFREIEPPEKLVYTDCPADEEGNAMPGVETLVTVMLDDLGGGRTKMTLRHEGLPAVGREGAGVGWNQAFEKLAAYLAEAAA